jgi:hypothetical protein
MTIELIGPRKYKFQDRVCAVVALLHAEDPASELKIEPSGGEDAQLLVGTGAAQRVVEIQVKGAKGKIDGETLADWLSHFPARKATKPLIERLIKNPTRVTVMIATGRCDDAVSTYVVQLEKSMEARPHGSVKKIDEVNIRSAFGAFVPHRSNDGTLKKAQRTYVGSYLLGVTKTNLRKAMHRVLVIERLDETAIRQIGNDLLSSLRVVPDLVESTFSQIEAIVFQNKGTDCDILPLIRTAIHEAQPQDPLSPPDYIPRGDEEALKKKLGAEKVLLLAGRPRIGKTTTSRWLAAELQKLAFRVRLAENVAAAQRYLMEPVREPRLALVDDPFGGAHLADDAARELSALEHLVPLLANDRRLIVVQAQDRLLEVSRKKSVEEMETSGVKWVEISKLDGSFLVQIWAQACALHSVPGWLSSRVSDALASEKLVLEPGCLIHLAVSHRKLTDNVELDAIARLAREDSLSLGRALSAEGLKPLVSALAVTTTPDRPVSLVELAFALGSGGPARPGMSNVMGKSISFGKRLSSTIDEPKYEPHPIFHASTEELMDRLEVRRIVEVFADGTYAFTHPFYRASSEMLLDAATTRTEKDALALADRSLFSLSSQTAEAAAKNLAWLYERLNTDSGRTAIIHTAVDGLKSIFPAARDSCFAFLAKRLKHLPAEFQSQISTWVNAVTYFDVTEVEWVKGLPRIPAGGFANTIEVDFLRKEVSETEIKQTLQTLASEDPIRILPEDAAKAAMFFEQYPDRLTLQSVGRLLSFDIALLRAPVIRAWLVRPRVGDDQVLERIFGEDHPAVAIAAFKAILRAWSDCQPERRDRLKQGLLRMACSPVAAAALIDRLVLFARREETGENPPWELFESLMPQVMGALATGTAFHEARLYNVLDVAVRHISIDSILQIVDYWIEFLHGVIENRVPSDYLLGVTDVLIRATSRHPEKREQRIRALLALSRTGSRARVIADLVDHWELLTREERVSVMEQLNTIGEDAHWLRATALARNEVPPEIESELLPSGLSLADLPSAILLQMPPELLFAGVQIFSGAHPNINHIGVHGARKSTWAQIVREIARNPQHPLFEFAWEHMMALGDGPELADLVQHNGTIIADLLFDLMLKQKLRTNGDFMPEAWEALFRIAPDDAIRKHWIARMAETAPTTLDGLHEVKSWVPKAYQNEFFSYFEADLHFLRILDVLLKGSNREENDTDAPPLYAAGLILTLRVLLIQAPPLHWETCEHIERMLRKLGVNDDIFLEELETLRRKMLDERSSEPPYYNPPLHGWVA